MIQHLQDIVEWATLILVLLSAAMPVLQKIAAMTATKTDDTALEHAAAFIHDALAFIPTLRFGKTLEQKQVLTDAKVTTPIAPP